MDWSMKSITPDVKKNNVSTEVLQLLKYFRGNKK